ncbi:transposase, partial [Phyllobacterium leguminum]
MTIDDEIQSVIGLDVSCDTVTLFDSLTSQTMTVANRCDELRSALEAFAGRGGLLAVCEATGGYEDELLAALAMLAIPAHRADAAKVKSYIRSFGKRAKTDAIDAQWLARYGCDRGRTLAPWRPAEANHSRISLLAARRMDLVAMRVQEKNRLKAPRARTIAVDIKDHIAELERRIDAIELEIKTLINNDPGLRQRESALRTIPGVGETIAAFLIATMPELGSMNRRQAACLAGCAPHPRDSGRMTGHRTTTGGRRHIRPMLFIAALTAIRGKNDLAAAYKAFL